MIHYFSNLNANTALSLLCPVAIWSVMLVFLWSLMLAMRDGVKYLQQLHQIPCDRCQYYTGTHYLKCPVHPMTALSEEAINCRDFEAITGCQPQAQHRRPNKDQVAPYH